MKKPKAVQVHALQLHLIDLALFTNDVGGELMERGFADEDVNKLTEFFQIDLLENHVQGRSYNETADLLIQLSEHPDNRIKAASLFPKFPFLMMYVLNVAAIIAESKYKIDRPVRALADVWNRDTALANELGSDIQPFAQKLVKWFYEQVIPDIAAHRIMSSSPRSVIFNES